MTPIDIIQRILAFPFFAGLSLIAAIMMLIRWIVNYAKYGGEAIAYTDKMSRKTIQDVFTELIKEDYTHEADYLDTKDPYCQCKNSEYGYAMPVCFTCKKQKKL